MKLVKRWMLNQNEFQDHDYLWLKKYAYKVDIKHDTHDVTTAHHTYKMAGKTTILVQTVTPEQENMLQLKYGDRMTLMSSTFVQENMVYQDQYGTIF